MKSKFNTLFEKMLKESSDAEFNAWCISHPESSGCNNDDDDDDEDYEKKKDKKEKFMDEYDDERNGWKEHDSSPMFVDEFGSAFNADSYDNW